LKSDRGAVTAELIVLMPTVLLGISLIAWLISLATAQLRLEQDAGYLLRNHLIGKELEVASDLSLELFAKGRLSCLALAKPGLVTLRTEQCGISLG
jgi:hypothetical protein